MAGFAFKIYDEPVGGRVVGLYLPEAPASVHAIGAIFHCFESFAFVAKFRIFCYELVD